MEHDDDPTMNVSPLEMGVDGPAKPSAPLAEGAYLGRYRLERTLGRGGMGEVFLADDTLLGRPVALKFIRGSGSDLVAQRRLLREAQVVARLRHPNIVEVYDAGTVEGRMFLAMEYVAGGTLRQWAQEQPPPWPAIVDAVVDVARGVAAAHAAGLLHRDIKPDNVMRAEDGRVVVLDFGLARAVDLVEGGTPLRPGRAVLDAPTLVDARLTRAADCLCTPRYAAPELLQTGACSQATDQYATAVMLYELLHGRPPFVGETVDQRLVAARAAPTFDATVPPALSRCITRALRWESTARYPSVDAFAAALLEIGRARGRRRRQIWAGFMAVGLALAAGGGYVAARSSTEPPPLELAAAVEADAIEAAARARYVYPPPNDPGAPTAFVKLLELDSLDSDRALHLREQFATALEELGDRYWERPGGGAFAADFYVQALLFDPTRARAAERATLSAAALADLEVRARRTQFTGGELVAGELLAAMAEDDDRAAARRVSALLDRDDATVPITVQQRARRAVGLEPRSTVALATAPADPSATAEGPTGADDGADGAPSAHADDAVVTPDHDGATGGAVDPAPRPRANDRKAAAALVKRGDAARASNQLAKAESHYSAALASSAGFAPALIGLSHTQFERGRYEAAARRARQAIRAAPNKAGYHLQLGDACFKSGALAEARRAYETAKTLGHAKAQGRLSRLAARTGGG